MAADAITIQSTVDKYVATMSAGDREGWLDLWADDATMEDPVGTPPNVGREAIGGFWDLVQGLSDSMWIELTGPVRVAAGECAFPMQAHSQLGDAAFVVDIIDVMAFDDEGRITAMRAFWDPAAMRPDES